MSAIPTLALGIFFLCCIAQIPLAWKIRGALEKRHPEALKEVSRGGWLFGLDTKILWFAWSRRVHELADPEISQAASQVKILHTLSIALWLGLFADTMATGHYP